MKIGIGNDHAAVVMKNEIAAYLDRETGEGTEEALGLRVGQR